MSEYRNTDWKSDLGVARSLTWRYVIALSLVASLATAAWISLHLVIAEQQSTAAVVNVSGRQRMLSQRTALFSNLLVNSEKAERAVIRDRLKDAIGLMERSHRGLTHGDQAMGLPGVLSPAIHAMYFDGPDALDGQVNAYIGTVKAFLLLPDDELTYANPNLQYITRTASTTLVTSLDQMVRQYQVEGEAAVGRLQQAETVFWLITLLLLVLEALLIFRPFSRHVTAIIGKLQGVTEKLRQHQSQLEDAVRQRTAELESTTRAMIESEEKFRLISTAAQDAIVIIGQEEKVIYWNPAAEKIFGYSANEACGNNMHILITPERYQLEAHQGFERFGRYGVGNLIGKTLEVMARHKSGYEFPIELSISAFRFQDSWHALGIIRDITVRKQAEEKLIELTASLRESEKRLTTLLDSTKIHMWAFDGTSYTYTNKQWFDYTGQSQDSQLTVERWNAAVHPDDLERSSRIWQANWEAKTEHDNYFRLRRHDGVYRDFYCHAVPILDEHGVFQYFQGFNLDVTERKEMEEQVRQLAFYDTLTSLPNRRLLNDRLSQTMAAGKRSGWYSALMFLDLDNFKPLNDNYGHVVGDLLLIEVADRLKHCVREVDTVARFGGDEFVVILNELDADKAGATAQAGIVAEKVHNVLAAPYLLTVRREGEADSIVEHRCTSSIGVIVFVCRECSGDDVLKWADEAMYQAKEAGGDLIRFIDPQALIFS